MDKIKHEWILEAMKNQSRLIFIYNVVQSGSLCLLHASLVYRHNLKVELENDPKVLFCGRTCELIPLHCIRL